jgi:hypothetical protein
MPAYNNKFRSSEYHEETIVSEQDGTVVGTIRIKPSSVLWKPSGAHKFYSVSLAKFGEWITHDDTKARKVKS